MGTAAKTEGERCNVQNGRVILWEGRIMGEIVPSFPSDPFDRGEEGVGRGEERGGGEVKEGG